MALMPANCWKAKMKQLMRTDLVVSSVNRPGFLPLALPGALGRPVTTPDPILLHFVTSGACNGHAHDGPVASVGWL